MFPFQGTEKRLGGWRPLALHPVGDYKLEVISRAPPLLGMVQSAPQAGMCRGAPLSQLPGAATASHMWGPERTGGSPDVVYFLWSLVTCVPNCQARIRRRTTQGSLHAPPPPPRF